MSENKLNVNKIKEDFPIFEREVDGNALVYLDSAATSQKPKQVIEAISNYYKNHNSNVHRGAHFLGDESTELYESAREKVAHFIGAQKPEEIIFTKNTTETINLVAYSWGEENITEGDVILLSEAEHNSNFLPWVQLAKTKNARVEYFELDEDGNIDTNQLEKIKKGVKLVAVSHASNVLGTIFDVKKICRKAKEVGATTLVDGSQAVPHLRVNIQSLGCDFYAFSGHKMLGPMGVGILWGQKELLDNMDPFLYGGGMILELKKCSENTPNSNLADRYSSESEHPEWMETPYRFEAGTPNVAGALGLAAAVDYLETIGMENITQHEQKLNEYALAKLQEIKDLEILGPKNPEERTGLVSFTITGIHPHDASSILNSVGIAVRSGTHCAMKLHNKLEINASIRASYYLYNNKEDIDKLVEGLKKAESILK